MQKFRLSFKWSFGVIVALIILAIYILEGISSTSRSTATHLPPATANLPKPSITMMSPKSELVYQQIKYLVERQANAWETADSDKIVADFADDSIFIVPGSTFRGKQEIKESAENYFTEFTETQVTLKRLITVDNEGALEWNWRDKNRKTGQESQAEDAIIFELEDGKIKYWREYIDTKPQGN